MEVCIFIAKQEIQAASQNRIAQIFHFDRHRFSEKYNASAFVRPFYRTVHLIDFYYSKGLIAKENVRFEIFATASNSRPTKHIYKIQEDSLWAANVTTIGLTIIWCTAWWTIKTEAAILVVAPYLHSSVLGWWYSVSWTTSPRLQPDGRKGGKFMTENKILVQIIDHANGNSVLGQDYFASREKAEEFKRISDRAYGKLLGEDETIPIIV